MEMEATGPIDIVEHISVVSDEVLEAVATVYVDAFGGYPYFETPADGSAFIDRVRRYEARDGFHLVVASDANDQLGFGLAVRARPGDWWRDQVAANLEQNEVAEWLGETCLELVHLGVRRADQGLGIGARIHDALLADRPAPTAILTVHPEAAIARALYLDRGWRRLRGSITIGAGPSAWLMGRKLS
jgi:hypothetical protein